MPDNVKVKKALVIYEGMKSLDANAAFQRFEAAVNKYERRRVKMMLHMAIAVIAIFIVAGGYLFLLRYTDADNKDVIPKLSGNVVLSLPDGSEIILNKNQQLGNIAKCGDVTVRNMENGGVEYVRTNDLPVRHYSSVMYNKLTISRGERYEIVLEDGTQIWLNSDSRLTFPSSFAHNEPRRIQLQGEAYMKVSIDPTRPFIVETGRQTVTVLGTEFNIAAYPDEPDIRTTLLSGSVRVNVAENETVLDPGQQSVLELSSGKLTVHTVDKAESVAWKEGVISIDRQNIDQIVRKLSRLYDIRFVITDDRVRNITLRGGIPRYDTLSEVLEVLEEISPIRFETKDNSINVSYY